MRFKFLRHSKVIQQTTNVPAQYHSLRTLLLSDFIAIICDKELFRLVKSGKPDMLQLAQQWDKVFIDYCDIIGQVEYATAIDTEKELFLLKSKINLVSLIIQVLMHVYVDDYVSFLESEYGINVEYCTESELYHEQFLRIEGRVKKWQVEYDLLILQQPKSEGSDCITKETFTRTRMVLSEFVGFLIREDITAEEFAHLVKRLSDHNKALENVNKKAA